MHIMDALDYRFTERQYEDLCDYAFRGKRYEIEVIVNSIPREKRALFGPTTFCPPVRYKMRSPLVSACCGHKLDVIEYLLQTFPHIIDVNAVAYSNYTARFATPLMTACMLEWNTNSVSRFDFRVIEYLILKGADVNTGMDDGTTALHCGGSLRTVRHLVEHGADINKADSMGFSPLLSVVDNSYINNKNKIEIIQYLLDKGANIYQRTTKLGYTVMHLACDKVRVLQFLLDYGLSPLFATTSGMDSIPCPLYLAACALSNREMITKLFFKREDCPIECRVNASLIQAAVGFLKTPEALEKAYYEMWVEGLELMKKHKVQLSYPPLLDEYDQRREVKTIEELDNIWGNTLEMLFQCVLIIERCLGGNDKMLLLVARAMLDAGYTREGQVIVERILKLEHNTISSQSCPLHVALSLANAKSSGEIMTVLSMWISKSEAKSAYVYPTSLISLVNEFVSKHLNSSERSSFLTAHFRLIAFYPSLLRVLLKAGADEIINEVDCHGRTILMEAVEGLYGGLFPTIEAGSEVIKILLQYGAHIDTTNSEGLTLFSQKIQPKLTDSLKNELRMHLPLSLGCITAKAIIKYCISCQGLPSHITKFINLHNSHYFSVQFEYYTYH